MVKSQFPAIRGGHRRSILRQLPHGPTELALLVAAVSALTWTRPADAETGKPPNVVYIMADELGYYELSCMGHPEIKTPRIDQLAKQGVRFTQGLAGSSLCALTRCCLMTGKHSGHTSVRSNGGGTPLRAGEATIASVLRSKGYATGGFGKWGCGGRGSTGVPEEHGFDVFLGYYDQVHAHTYYPPYLVRNSEEVKLAGNQGGRSGETYSQYVIMEGALKFIRDHREQPFFCYLPITPPHGLFDIPADDPALKPYADKDWPQDVRNYAAMISMVDRQVGQVLDLLKQLGLDDNTIVFFCGDNGGNDYFASAERKRGFFAPNVDPRTGTEFRGRKGTLFEGGLRIPMMARWPGKIQPGRVSDHLWYFPDVLPTLAELAGADAPADVDGLSIVPELLGEQAAGRKQASHPFLYWELGGQVAVRDSRWKAIRLRGNDNWQLYDLEKDVSETKDVAADNPQVLAKMKQFAADAHTPAEEGTFKDRSLHERDRAAKWGGKPPATGKANRMPLKGLVSVGQCKVVRVSSESRAGNRLAVHALDGNPRTHWHTQYTPELKKHPHELVVDLGAVRTIRGFRYLARQDGGWNGALGKCEFSISDSPDAFGDAVATATFTKTRRAQDAKCPPTKGRYIRLRVLSEVNGNAWASIAELGVIGE